MLPWAHPSPCPKRHIDRFSRFRTAHGGQSLKKLIVTEITLSTKCTTHGGTVLNSQVMPTCSRHQRTSAVIIFITHHHHHHHYHQQHVFPCVLSADGPVYIRAAVGQRGAAASRPSKFETRTCGLRQPPSWYDGTELTAAAAARHGDPREGVGSRPTTDTRTQ